MMYFDEDEYYDGEENPFDRSDWEDRDDYYDDENDEDLYFERSEDEEEQEPKGINYQYEREDEDDPDRYSDLTREEEDALMYYLSRYDEDCLDEEEIKELEDAFPDPIPDKILLKRLKGQMPQPGYYPIDAEIERALEEDEFEDTEYDEESEFLEDIVKILGDGDFEAGLKILEECAIEEQKKVYMCNLQKLKQIKKTVKAITDSNPGIAVQYDQSGEDLLIEMKYPYPIVDFFGQEEYKDLIAQSNNMRVYPLFTDKEDDYDMGLEIQIPNVYKCIGKNE